MDFLLPSVAAGLLILKVVDFARYARARDLNGVLTQFLVWAGGIVVLFLLAHTVWGKDTIINGVPLSKLDNWSVVFAGLSIASGSSLVKDTLKAVDNHNTAKIPTLLPVGPQPVTAEDVG